MAIHPNDDLIDIAIIEAEIPYPDAALWLREPRPAEPVLIMAYPLVPQVNDRPLLRFTGNIASEKPIKTYFGNDQTIVAAIMDPGSSGGPVFSEDDNLVGIVVKSLEGKYSDEQEKISFSLFHAIIPSNILLNELPKFDYRLRLLNKWASDKDFDDIKEDFPSLLKSIL